MLAEVCVLAPHKEEGQVWRLSCTKAGGRPPAFAGLRAPRQFRKGRHGGRRTFASLSRRALAEPASQSIAVQRRCRCVPSSTISSVNAVNRCMLPVHIRQTEGISGMSIYQLSLAATSPCGEACGMQLHAPCHGSNSSIGASRCSNDATSTWLQERRQVSSETHGVSCELEGCGAAAGLVRQ